MQKVILKDKAARSVKNRHHWIFSEAISKAPKFEDGDILPVYDSQNNFLGKAYFNSKSKVTGRIITFKDVSIEKALEDAISNAVQLRQQLFGKETNTYRLVNGEGDNLPGLIVDKYAEVLVIQISTLGIAKLKPQILEILKKYTQAKAIYENSEMGSRQQEGLNSEIGWVTNKTSSQIEVIENGIKFRVDIENSHKTGLYLDQREMRKRIGEIATNKNVLNCFSYTGGFSLYAAAHEAKQTTSVDLSAEVIAQAQENFKLNGFSENKHQFVAADVFDYLKEAKQLDFDIVILDPPAFAKKKKDVQKAFNGYKQINRLALQKMPANSYLLTASCSYHMTEDLFQKMLFQAASSTKRQIRIIGKHIHAPDHPLNIYNPEQDYLKSFLLYVS